MTPKRREQILASLRAGNLIYRSWDGTNNSGYLSHRLADVPRLRESEVEELRAEGLLEVHQRTGIHRTFRDLRLKVIP